MKSLTAVRGGRWKLKILISALTPHSVFTSFILEKCQENNKCIKGQRRTNRPFQAFITFAAGYSRGAWAAVLTFGLFLHHVESHTVVAPNNVTGKDPGAACLCLLLLCRKRNNIMIHILSLPLTPQSILEETFQKPGEISFRALIYYCFAHVL